MKEEDIHQLSVCAVKTATEYAIDYVDHIRQQPVFPVPASLKQMAQFESTLSEHGRTSQAILTELHKVGSPATVASTGGRYFGLVVGGSLPAAMGANILSSAWDQVALMVDSSPVSHRLEEIAARWILELLGFSTDAHVGFVTGTTMAHVSALSAAREYLYERVGFNLAEQGMTAAPDITIVLSEQIHITVIKALRLLGFGRAQFRFVPCDTQGRIDVNQFPEISSNSIVILQAGNVNSGASDNFADLIPKAKAAGAWVHVDGAFGLWAAASPKYNGLVKGVEHADSWAVDGHKWLNTPYDCGLVIVRDRQQLHKVMSTSAAYLSSNDIVNAKDVVPEFSRRARGVEVWAALSELGKQGLVDLVDRCCGHAKTFAQALEGLGFEILNDVVLNQVVAKLESNQLLDDMVRQVQASGECWFGKTVWNGHHAIRISVSSWATTDEDVSRSVQAIHNALKTSQAVGK